MAPTVETVPDGSFPHCVGRCPVWTRPIPPPARCCASSCSRTSPGSPPTAWPAASAARPARRAATWRSCARPGARPLRPRALWRLPARQWRAAPTGDVQRHRGARPGHGGARRPPRRRRRDRTGGRGPRQGGPGPAHGGGRAGPGDPPDHRTGPRPRGRATRPRDDDRAGPGQLAEPSGPAAVPVRGRDGVGDGGRPVGGRGPARPVVPAVPSRVRASVRAYRLDRMRDVEPLDEPFERPADLDPVAMLEQHLAVGWEYAVEVVVESSVDQVRPYLSPALGRLEAVDAGHTRLTGTTGNPYWYAEQLAVIPAPFRVSVGWSSGTPSPALGRRLLDASPVLGLGLAREVLAVVARHARRDPGVDQSAAGRSREPAMFIARGTQGRGRRARGRGSSCRYADFTIVSAGGGRRCTRRRADRPASDPAQGARRPRGATLPTTATASVSSLREDRYVELVDRHAYARARGRGLGRRASPQKATPRPGCPRPGE